MSLFEYLLSPTYKTDNEWRQRHDIEALRERAVSDQRLTEQRQHDSGRRIQELEEQVGELALLCRTLLRVLTETRTIDADRFYEVLADIDAEDGQIDGMATPPP